MVKALKNALVFTAVVMIAIIMIAVYSLAGAEQREQKLVVTNDLQAAAGSEAVQPAAVVPANFDQVLPGSAIQGQ